MTVTTAPGGSKALRPVLCIVQDLGDGWERKKKKKRSSLGHFFPLRDVYVNGLALGAMKWRLQRSVSLATNISKSHQILTPFHTHTHTYAQSAPLHLSRDQTRGLGKRWPPFGPPSCPLHPAQEGDGRKPVPPSTPTLLPWRASRSTSINLFWGRVEAGVKHRQMHWKECSSLK